VSRQHAGKTRKENIGSVARTEKSRRVNRESYQVKTKRGEGEVKQEKTNEKGEEGIPLLYFWGDG